MNRFEISEARRNSGLSDKVIYQLFLRTFTKEGTIAAATEQLPHIADIGADIVYICPFCEQDADENRENWSPRQKASGIPNPKNPYRISDYFKIDEEYGTDADFEQFVQKAHALGLSVMVDLVYMHAGPGKFVQEHPDFVQKNADGNIRFNNYNFPLLDFENPDLCEYLWTNMEYWIRRFDADGFRADVGDHVPLWFWAEGRKRCEKYKKIVMLNEGNSAEYLKNVFDAEYSFIWSAELGKAVRGNKSFHTIRLAYEGEKAKNPDDALVLRAYENHDYASDAYENRLDRIAPDNTDAALVLNFVSDGIPFIYNGNEIADGGRHSIWNRPKDGFSIDWSKAGTARAEKRLGLTKKLCRLKHTDPLFSKGEGSMPKDSELLLFTRRYENRKLEAYFNFGKEPITRKIAVGEQILAGNCSVSDGLLTLGSGGYYVQEMKNDEI